MPQSVAGRGTVTGATEAPGRYFAISGNCAQLSAVNASCTCEPQC